MDTPATLAAHLARLSPGTWVFLVTLALLGLRALLIRLLGGR